MTTKYIFIVPMPKKDQVLAENLVYRRPDEKTSFWAGLNVGLYLALIDKLPMHYTELDAPNIGIRLEVTGDPFPGSAPERQKAIENKVKVLESLGIQVQTEGDLDSSNLLEWPVVLHK